MGPKVPFLPISPCLTASSEAVYQPIFTFSPPYNSSGLAGVEYFSLGGTVGGYVPQSTYFTDYTTVQAPSGLISKRSAAFPSANDSPGRVLQALLGALFC